MTRHFILSRLAGLAACTLFATSVQASEGPPLKIMVGFPPGGGTDTVARHLADALRTELQRNVVIENRSGASGQIAAQALKSSAPDGNTLFLSNSHAIAMIPLTVKNPGYDPMTDFAPVSLVSITPDVLAISPKVAENVSTLQEFGAWAKAEPTKASVGVPGVANAPDFAVGLIGKGLGAKLVSIPYRGDAPIVQDLMAGQVPAGIGGVGVMLEPSRSGRIKIIAVNGTERLELLPDVPTYAEHGIRGYEEVMFNGVFAPAGTPAELIEKYNAAITKVVNSEAFKRKLADIGFIAKPSTPEELRARQANAIAVWTDMVRNAGYTPQ